MEGNRNVWTFENADVDIYGESSSGTPTSYKLLSVCFLEGFSMAAAMEQTRRAVTNRSVLKITNREFTYTGNIDSLFYLKEQDINFRYIFNRRRRLRMVLTNTDTTVDTGRGWDRIERLTLTGVYASSVGVSSQKGDLMKISASFAAEGIL